MNIGIIVAMGKELELLKPLLEQPSEREVHGTTFHCGHIGGHQVVAMQCGIGKVNAAVGTVTLVDNFPVDAIVNTGVAGGAGNGVCVMDVVAGQRIAYHDVWCGFDSTWGQIQGMPLYFESDPAMLSIARGIAGVKCGLICSGDRFIDSMADVEAIESKFPGVLAVDMESAAIAQVCHIRHKAFLSVRVISDSPGASHDNSQQYADFWTDAPKHTFEVIKHLLQKLQ